MNKQTLNRLTLRVILPLLIGGLTYIIFRSDNLLMFRWFNNLGMGKIVSILKQLNYVRFLIPNWIIFNLPDALWIFSFTNCMLLIWRFKFAAQSIFWIFIAPAIGVFSEIGQELHIVPGTFDSVDMIFIIVASLLPFISMLPNVKSRLYGKV